MSSLIRPKYLRRYTDLPSLLHLLSTKNLTLLDPKTWDDQNDSYFMSLYKTQLSLNSLLALCFSQAPETYHHWRVFSNGPSGVCIVFDKDSLLSSLNKQIGITSRPVEYFTLKKAEEKGFVKSELPFVKRYGFEPEKEFRVVYSSKDLDTKAYLNININLSSIRSISLSPWMHKSLSSSTIKAIRSINDCSKLRVSRSTLISNDQWKTFGINARD